MQFSVGTRERFMLHCVLLDCNGTKCTGNALSIPAVACSQQLLRRNKLPTGCYFFACLVFSPYDMNVFVTDLTANNVVTRRFVKDLNHSSSGQVTSKIHSSTLKFTCPHFWTNYYEIHLSTFLNKLLWNSFVHIFEQIIKINNFLYFIKSLIAPLKFWI